MKQYRIEEFIWFTPAPEKRYAISFPREKAFNLNTALRAELGDRIDIAFHPTEPVVCLRKAQGENGLPVPASGSLTSAALSERLLASGIRPPVRLSVRKQDEYWLAIPEETKIPETVSLAKPARQPRKVNAARILQGIETP